MIQARLKKDFLASEYQPHGFTVGMKTHRLSESQGFPLGAWGVFPQPDSFLRKASRYFQTENQSGSEKGGFHTGVLLATKGAHIPERRTAKPSSGSAWNHVALSPTLGQLSERKGQGRHVTTEPSTAPPAPHTRPRHGTDRTWPLSPQRARPRLQSHHDMTYLAAATFSRNGSPGKILQPERLPFRMSQVFSVKLLMFLINFCHPQLLQCPEAWRD